MAPLRAVGSSDTLFHSASMGPPVLYLVGGVVVTLGAALAFKEVRSPVQVAYRLTRAQLVYDPYIHPRIEAFLARREGRRLARGHLAEAQFLTEPRAVSYPVRLRDVRRRKVRPPSAPPSPS